jgi:hypothetical protein
MTINREFMTTSEKLYLQLTEELYEAIFRQRRGRVNIIHGEAVPRPADPE